MKSVIIFFAVLIAGVEARRVLSSNYMKDMNKSINRMCNKEAFITTNNLELFNCFNSNNVLECKLLNNYDEYMKIKYTCIKKYQDVFSYGILISIVMWILVGFTNS